MSFANFKQEDNRVASNMDARKGKNNSNLKGKLFCKKDTVLVEVENNTYHFAECFSPVARHKGRDGRAEAEANAAFICKAVNNFDTLMDALSQCHNLFEAEEKQLSDEGKQVWQVVIAAILKANSKT